MGMLPQGCLLTGVCNKCLQNLMVSQSYRPRQKEIHGDKYVLIRRQVALIKWEELHLGEIAVI